MKRDYSVPIGKIFGRLLVLNKVSGRGKTKVLCRCSCGRETIVRLASLKSGNTVSCGCAHIRHGMHKSPEYAAWSAMIQRCTNPKCAEWKNYGARGIKVCAEWRDFQAFFAAIGKRPTRNHSLDRYPNNDGDYEPGNVRWATPTQQGRNTRRNIVLSDGRKLVDAADEAGISKITARNRRRLGWPDDALFERENFRGKRRPTKSE